ncbi:hypothetical protein chiPu_0015148 [Chiloscyllium punctatum]|uniref:Uncharacterized protein n=1 Tax=Chiloscyllium punctatum TaxID=137246 RepID=A0A401T1X6_CHIPU|nr:hypothetical protein [Chiloscyllium punctatum]
MQVPDEMPCEDGLAFIIRNYTVRRVELKGSQRNCSLRTKAMCPGTANFEHEPFIDLILLAPVKLHAVRTWACCLPLLGGIVGVSSGDHGNPSRKSSTGVPEELAGMKWEIACNLWGNSEQKLKIGSLCLQSRSCVLEDDALPELGCRETGRYSLLIGWQMTNQNWGKKILTDQAVCQEPTSLALLNRMGVWLGMTMLMVDVQERLPKTSQSSAHLPAVDDPFGTPLCGKRTNTNYKPPLTE